MSGARPPGQARRLLLAGRHGNRTMHFGKGIRVPTQFRAPNLKDNLNPLSRLDIHLYAGITLSGSELGARCPGW